MKKLWKTLSLLAAAVAVSACGGGGGSSGTVSAEYQITLRADKTQLPTNVADTSPGTGVYSPFTTVLHVSATVNGQPIPGGEDIFGCNLAAGLNSGALYYLDGDPEHMVEGVDENGNTVKIPGAYRSITLGSNSGGNSFHFHAGNAAGTARITCSVTDPRDKQQKAASVDIVVGGTTGKAASVRVNSTEPDYGYYLGTRTNLSGLKNQMAIVVALLDDANQPIASASAPNLQVSIRSGSASGARLVSDSQSGNTLQLRTGGSGTAQFTLLSGDEPGPIILEFAADRYDNNVQNGIQDAIVSMDYVYAIDASTTALTTAAIDLGEVTTGIPFNYQLTAQGGLPPYTWSITGLPKGLSADSSGLISGTPDDVERTYIAKATVVDRNKLAVSANVTLKLVKGVAAEDFFITGCVNKGINEPCALPDATPNNLYTYAFSASVTGVTWEFSRLPTWLTSGTAGASGYVSGTPTGGDPTATPPKYGDCGIHRFLVTAKKGASSVTRQASVSVVSGTLCP